MAISVGRLIRHFQFTLCVTQTCYLAVIVGDSSAWMPELIERAKSLQVNGGFEAGADL